MFECPAWGCSLEDVNATQLDICEKCGLDCMDCMEPKDAESEE